MFESLLLAVPPDESSGVVVEHALAMAEQFGATVHVVTVVDVRTLSTAPHGDERREEAATVVDDVASRFEDAGVPVETAVRTDVPSEGILSHAREVDVDVLVVGTHGRRGFEHFRLGSVAEAVLRGSTVPVVTIPLSSDRDPQFPYENVLVPVDDSAEATAATAWGISLAASSGAVVHALSVVETSALGLDVRSEIYENAMQEPASEAVDAVAARAAESDVDARTSVVSGVPDAEIREYVEENDVDVVVMGTHGRSGVDRVLLGSVAERTIRTTQVPVVTVQAGGDRD